MNTYPQGTNISPIYKIFIFTKKYLSFEENTYRLGINIYLYGKNIFMGKLFIQERQFLSSKETNFPGGINFYPFSQK
jgi:hypothetical protein